MANKKKVKLHEIVEGLEVIHKTTKEANAGFVLLQMWKGLQNSFEASVFSWDEIIKIICIAAKLIKEEGDEQYGDVFNYGFSQVSSLVKPDFSNLEEILRGVIIINNQTEKENKGPVFRLGLTLVIRAGIVTESNWLTIADDMVRMIKSSGKWCKFLFNDQFGNIEAGNIGARIINEKTWPTIVSFIVSLGDSKPKIRMLSYLKNLTSEQKVFLLYLMEYRPKKALDFLVHSRLLYVLGAYDAKKMKLFLIIAAPLTGLEAEEEKLLQLLIPLNKIPASYSWAIKCKEYLDQSLETFQGVKADFTELMIREGLEPYTSYSFIQLVYIFLKYAENPDLKLSNLQKSLQKIEKESGKIILYLKQKKRSDVDTKRFRASLVGITELFYTAVESLYLETHREEIAQKISLTFAVKPKDLERSLQHPSLENAILLWKKLTDQKLKEGCFTLLQNFFAGNIYPLKKVAVGYPCNLPENRKWLKQNRIDHHWLKDFQKTYTVDKGDFKETNIKDQIQHHLEDAKRILLQLGIKLKELNILELEAEFKKIKANHKSYDEALVNDLKTQIKALKSLSGQEALQAVFVDKVTILPEFDPLEILQLGNYVQGSCLALEGSNHWSALVNALEVNKRVLWAKDSRGNVLGRLLIAVDRHKKIVRFRVYYATTLLLDRFFNDYIKELAKKGGFEVNGNATEVEHLLFERWYTDLVTEIKD